MLNNILPYFITRMEDESLLVQTEAAEGAMEMLDSIQMPVTLSPTDFKVFKMYIMPAYQKLSTSSSNYVKAAFMKLIGKICYNGKRFVEQGIANQEEYFISLAAIEKLNDEFKSKRKSSIDFQVMQETTTSDLDTEIDEIGSTILLRILDITCRMPHLYQSSIARNLYHVGQLLGPKKFESVATLLFAMLNSKVPQVVAEIFDVAPGITAGIGRKWLKTLLTCFDVYMLNTEESVVCSVVKCFANFAKMKLLDKDQMINLCKHFSPYLLYPNEWLRSAALDYVNSVGTCLNDTEFFTYIRPILQPNTRNFVLTCSSSPFSEHLLPPLPRIVVDLVEAGVRDEVRYTAEDKLARSLFEAEILLEDMRMPDISDSKKRQYEKHKRTIVQSCSEQILNCIGRSAKLAAVLKSKGENRPLIIKGRNTVELPNDFEVHDREIDQYIPRPFVVHIPPSCGNFFADNNGMNPKEYYENYIASHTSPTKWLSTFKNATLCKALSFHEEDHTLLQLKDRQNNFYTYTATRNWSSWVPQGRLMTTLNTHKAPVYSITVSDDMRFMATGSADGVCCLWDNWKLKDSVMAAVDKVEVEGKITALKFLENTHSIAIGNSEGKIGVYRVDRQEFATRMGRMMETGEGEEGGIVNCCTYLSSNGQNVLVYATQQGGIHVHDIRVKKDVNRYMMKQQRGLITSFCMGRSESSFFVGTVGGSVLGYDLRFNLVTSLRNYSRRTPITDMSVYLPEASRKTQSHNESTPLLFVASGEDTPQVDLFSLDKSVTEWSFAVGNPHLAYRTYVPYELVKEGTNFTDVNYEILRRLSKGFPLSKMEEVLSLSNRPQDCHLVLKEFCDKIKTMYEQSSQIYRILCPRTLRNARSAPFLLTAGADRVVRYWHLGSLASNVVKANAREMVKRSFLVVSPDDREVEYVFEDFKEKVLYEHVISRDTPAHAEGQSEWQSHNGVCYLRSGIVKVPCPSHTDAILNMELIDLPFKIYLVTCGRDNLVKIWT